ncbi:MAG: DNA topoisomerase [Watsoniomyces obsoletus]|nr:MAG: DNA topoisomerase [Watsoniomyces obsoletus]
MDAALPAIKSISECADFSKTVQPFLPQLQELPGQILQSWSNPESLKQLYLSTNPLVTALGISLFLAPIFLIVSEINKNYSQVDRAWSLLPTLYNAHFALYAHLAGLPTDRVDTVLAFSAVWSARLTFNYWRKGGYQRGSEDYRWELVKKWLGQPGFFLFNVIFIAYVQNILLLAISAPTYILLLGSKIAGDKNTTADLLFTRGLVTLVLVEWFADQQQWNYQQAKIEYQKTAKVPSKFIAEDLDRGFVVSGLWAWSRHPNFAAEQAIWTLLYQYSCYISQTYYNWTGLGCFALILLFQASTWLTELISARKYPEYKEYQMRVGKFIPKLSTDLPGYVRDPVPLKSKESRGEEEVKPKSKESAAASG